MNEHPPQRAPQRAPERPAGSTDPRAAWARFVTGTVAIVGAFVVAYLVELPGFSMCTFQALFGRPCPGCGMTRSITHLVRGDVMDSLRFHPLGIVLFVGAVLWAVGGLLEIVRGRDPFWEFTERRGVWIAVGLIGSLLLLWVIRGYVVPEWSPDPVGNATGWQSLLR